MRSSRRCLWIVAALPALGAFAPAPAPAALDRGLLSPQVGAAPVQEQGKRIVVKLSAGAGETVGVIARGRVLRRGRDFKLRRAVATVVAGARTKMALRPRKDWQERKLLRAIRQGRTLTAELTVKLSDLLGNGVERKVVVKLT